MTNTHKVLLQMRVHMMHLLPTLKKGGKTVGRSVR